MRDKYTNLSHAEIMASYDRLPRGRDALRNPRVLRDALEDIRIFVYGCQNTKISFPWTDECRNLPEGAYIAIEWHDDAVQRALEQLRKLEAYPMNEAARSKMSFLREIVDEDEAQEFSRAMATVRRTKQNVENHCDKYRKRMAREAERTRKKKARKEAKRQEKEAKRQEKENTRKYREFLELGKQMRADRRRREREVEQQGLEDEKMQLEESDSAEDALTHACDQHEKSQFFRVLEIDAQLRAQETRSTTVDVSTEVENLMEELMVKMGAMHSEA